MKIFAIHFQYSYLGYVREATENVKACSMAEALKNLYEDYKADDKEVFFVMLISDVTEACNSDGKFMSYEELCKKLK